MFTDLQLVLALLGATVVMFACNRPRMDAAALIMLTALPFTGIITMDEALAGFGDANVILIAALFVIGEALVRTGVAQHLGDRLGRHAGRSERRLIPALMTIVCGTGAFMSSTGVVAIFIPVVLRIARQAAIPAARLMMPLSVAALVSGMLTLVATPPNLVVQSALQREGLAGFGFFAFTPFGLPVLVLAILYMLAVRKRLGARARDAAVAPPARPRLAQWVTEYGLEQRVRRLAVQADSPMVGRRLAALDLRATAGIDLLAIERRQRFGTEIVEPRAETVLAAGDILVVDLCEPANDPAALCARSRLQPLPLQTPYDGVLAQHLGLAEVLIPPGSSLIDRTVVDTRFRSLHDLVVIGHRHGRDAPSSMPRSCRLHAGDTLLVTGPWRAIRRLRGLGNELIVLNLPAELDEVLAAPGRATWALAALALTVVLMVSGAVPHVQAALLGCLLLGLTGCIDMNGAYRAIHWQSLVLIVGMLPFALALERTGGVDQAAAALLTVLDGSGPRSALAALFALTALLGLFISNTATAVLMAPVALALADALGCSPYPFAMTVALAASAAFMTPVSSPVNTLVVGPGGYRFMDFVRIGVPFAIVTLAVAVLLVPLAFPF